MQTACSKVALDLLRKRTNASIVGFLSVNEDGGLQPKFMIPRDAASRVTLNQSLTELVSRQGHAVWVANQSSTEGTENLGHFADAVCAPSSAARAANEPPSAPSTSTSKTVASANPISISLSPSPTSSPSRSSEPALMTLQNDYQRLVEKSPGYDELIGNCRAMNDLKSKINRIARAPGCVLVRGESGSGKELVARAIHHSSQRADRPMVSVNCAAIPADLMESQLFGHKAGSFTGADRDHIGFFQQADLGTLFLDEVGELTPAGQAKLLRILEGHPFLPVGGTEEISVDVRVIAATNQNLQKYVRDKRFREDLYYRLSVFELHLPPLRDRDDDIGLLIDFFLDHFRRLHGRPNLNLTDAARTKLLTYHWPGNIRQLRNVLDSAVVLADDDSIRPHDLALRDAGTSSTELETLRIDEWEKRLITEALNRTSDNVPEAAKLLGIGRATLYRKIEQYHIER